MINPSVVVRTMKYGSQDYLQSINLRDLILRKPIGRSIKDDNLVQEQSPDYHHIGAFIDNNLVGTIILIKRNSLTCQMKQFAVDNTIQSKGIGSKIIKFTEQYAKEQGFKQILVHARKTALQFYQKMDYPVISDEFYEVGIPHRELLKEI